jgi:hypothetical protein
MGLSLRYHPSERTIFLEEDVYVVIGDEARQGTRRDAWPAAGSYAPVPGDSALGALGDVLGALGPELWRGKRKGPEACLVGQVETYDVSTVLEWGADCVEHLARRVRGVDGNVVETLALARRYAREHEFQAQDAERLAAEAERMLVRQRKWGLASFARALVSRAGQLQLGGVGSLLGPSETRYEAGEYASADLRALQVALMHASRELCHADPLAAGREAARWSRRASARDALAKEAGDRANAANDAGWLNLLVNPFASGTLARSLPGQVKAIEDGDAPETEWQAARLHAYLEHTGDTPLPSPAPW